MNIICNFPVNIVFLLSSIYLFSHLYLYKFKVLILCLGLYYNATLLTLLFKVFGPFETVSIDRHTHKHMHVHTLHAHKQIHTDACAQIHVYTIDSHVHMHIHTNMQTTCAHMCTQTYTLIILFLVATYFMSNI